MYTCMYVFVCLDLWIGECVLIKHIDILVNCNSHAYNIFFGYKIWCFFNCVVGVTKLALMTTDPFLFKIIRSLTHE